MKKDQSPNQYGHSLSQCQQQYFKFLFICTMEVFSTQELCHSKIGHGQRLPGLCKLKAKVERGACITVKTHECSQVMFRENTSKIHIWDLISRQPPVCLGAPWEASECSQWPDRSRSVGLPYL